MAHATEFLHLLDDAIERRVQSIRRLVVPGLGAPKLFTKLIRNRMRNRLLESATAILVRKIASKEFKKLVKRRRLRSIQGYGLDGRFEHIYRWARRMLRGPIVYAFWSDGKCLYVGKGESYKRLKAYKKSAYLYQAGHLETWQIKTISRLPAAEGLAIHLHDPRDNKKKAAKKKWGRKCPVCIRHDELKDELNSLLRLKG